MISRVRGMLAWMPGPGWMLFALVTGFLSGAALESSIVALNEAMKLTGGLWLDALRMTIIPLIFALVVTGVADLARADDGPAKQIGVRLPIVLIALLFASAIVAAIVVPQLLQLMPLPADVIQGLRANLPSSETPAIPSVAESVKALVPVNIVASAAEGAIVPLVLFALVFGLALSGVERTRATATLEPFRGLADAMIKIVGWVLWVAPIGIFALAYMIGATVGVGAAIAIGQYILIQIIVALLLAALCYGLAITLGGVALGRFARAVAPAQAVALGTQSSIAALPAMLANAHRAGVSERDAGVTLPFAVAVFKITAPSVSLLFGLSMAWMAGVEVSVGQIILAVPLAVLSTLMILGMPGMVSLFAATTPTALALGAPIELLPVLLAVDTIPDMFRTMANVTADMTAAVLASPKDKAGSVE